MLFKFLKYKKGKYPLRISNNSTIAAIFLFPALKTFVAPIFPEPIFLISPMPYNLGIR